MLIHGTVDSFYECFDLSFQSFCCGCLCIGYSFSPAFPESCLPKQEVLASPAYWNQDCPADCYFDGLCHFATLEELGGDHRAWLVQWYSIHSDWGPMLETSAVSISQGFHHPDQLLVAKPAFYHTCPHTHVISTPSSPKRWSCDGTAGILWFPVLRSESESWFSRIGWWTAESKNNHCACFGCLGRSGHTVWNRVVWQCPEATVEGYQATQREGESPAWAMCSALTSAHKWGDQCSRITGLCCHSIECSKLPWGIGTQP